MNRAFPAVFSVTADDTGTRLDQFLLGKIGEVSRARVQQMIEQGLVLVNGAATKASLRLRGGEEGRGDGPAGGATARGPRHFAPSPRRSRSKSFSKMTTWQSSTSRLA